MEEKVYSILERIESMLETQINPEYITIKEASGLLRCSNTKIRRMINSGELPFSRVGDSEKCTILIKVKDIRTIING